MYSLPSQLQKVADSLPRGVTRFSFALCVLLGGFFVWQPTTDTSWQKLAPYLAVFIAWLLAELEDYKKRRQELLELRQPSPAETDMSLYRLMRQTVGQNRLRWLRDHDFGVTWHEDQLSPFYNFSDHLDSLDFRFFDAELQQKLEDVDTKLDGLLYKVSHYGGPIREMRFSMIPDHDRATDDWSEPTRSRVKEVNEMATEVYQAFEDLYVDCRQKLGISIYND